MLGLGWTEMLIVGVVALIVIGPKDLPDLMNKIGRFAGSIRKMGQDFQRELNKTTGLNEITDLRKSITQPLKATTDAIRKEFNTTTASGAVEPSGAIKPTTPGAESVVDELHAAAGMKLPLTPAEAMKQAVAKSVANAPSVATPPVAAAAAVKAAPRKTAAKSATPKATADETPKATTVADKPAKPKATPKAKAAPKPIDSPAPVEAVAPAKRTRKPAAKAETPGEAAATPDTPPAETPPKSTARRKPAAKKN